MATIINIPSAISSGLRCVQYQFEMPSIGVAPEEKYLMYRLKNVTNNEYLTNWKFYKPVSDGQLISIDFVKDLQGILSTGAPPFSTVGIQSNINVLKTIEVEYGERTVNTETCDAPVDTVEGTTDMVDVLNGIPRNYQAISLIGTVLTKRIPYYTVSKDSKDWIYVVGEVHVNCDFFDGTDNYISSVSYSSIQTHPNVTCKIFPTGFQVAPPSARYIRVYANTTGTFTADDLLYTLDSNFAADHEGAITDIYFQNNMGGIDLLSFQRVEGMGMSTSRQEIVQRFECGINNLATGQRLTINNESFPTIQFKRQFKLPISLHESKWLNELAASNNAYVRETVISGGIEQELLVKFQLTNGEVVTYGGTKDFVISGYYSEVYLFPN